MSRRDAVIYALARRIPLSAVLERYGLMMTLKRVGRSFVGCCAIHSGSNKRQFVFNPARQTWRCFSPHHDTGGGVLEFVAEFERITTREAADLIVQWFALAPIEHRKRRKAMAGERPSHKAFVVEDRGEGDQKDAFWTRVGSAWEHADQKGFNVVLSALPANGRLVLRTYTEEDADDDKKASAQKGAKRR